MIYALHNILEGKKLLLASGSPRRHELLRLMDVEFEVVSNAVDESYPSHLKREEIVLFLSEKKSKGFTKSLNYNEILITSDTIVWLNNHPLEKANSPEHAAQMLHQLSGNKHTVYTAVTLRSNSRMRTFYEATEVLFSKLNDEEIAYYITQYKPFDKAGAYGMQEWIGINKVEAIYGSYTNVVGLPTARLYRELSEFIL